MAYSHDRVHAALTLESEIKATDWNKKLVNTVSHFSSNAFMKSWILLRWAGELQLLFQDYHKQAVLALSHDILLANITPMNPSLRFVHWMSYMRNGNIIHKK
ncbi:hypothetical protein TNCV_4306921 [Trichonephila clavipes]|nr:hypothetical protein TNCV_4306921 [Trichonephila clavipes]